MLFSPQVGGCVELERLWPTVDLFQLCKHVIHLPSESTCWEEYSKAAPAVYNRMHATVRPHPLDSEHRESISESVLPLRLLRQLGEAEELIEERRESDGLQYGESVRRVYLLAVKQAELDQRK